MRRSKSSGVVLLLVLAALAAALPAGAETSEFHYGVPEPLQKATGAEIYFSIEGFGTSTTPYYPVLPTRRVAYEIPFAATDVRVSVVPQEIESLGSFENFLMRQPPMEMGNPHYQPPAPPDRIPETIPESFCLYGGERVLRGHHLIEVALYPLQYRSSTHEVRCARAYAIRVDYVMPVDQETSQRAAKEERSPDFEPLASNVIQNYAEMNPPSFDEDSGEEYAGRSRYDLENPAYAIITTPTFAAEAERLAEWKTRKGVPTAVYLLSWIESNYSGYDAQEKIRNFLRLSNSAPRFDYVLLIGDSNIIPARYCWSEDGNVPCDYYYSDVVDGAIGASYDWDTDNDRSYGEFADVVTWLPDCYVGRIASRTLSEVAGIVDNIIAYETAPPSGSWVRKAIFGSAFANYPMSGYDPTDMANVAEWVRNDFLTPQSFPSERLYEAAGIYPTSHAYDYALTATNFSNRVAPGCGFAFPSGHGDYMGNYRLVWSYDDGDGYYDDYEGDWADLCTQSYNPATAGKKPYVLVGACLAGEFDRTQPCLGDFIISHWGIGAVASNRTSYYCIGWDQPDWPWNQGQEYRWWEEIFANGKYHMGQIHGDNKYNYAQDFNSLYGGDYGPDVDYASRKNLFISTLFGDPELPVWTTTPASLTVSHNATLPLETSTFAVTVSSGGGALSGATVCLWKDTEIYQVATTNASGVASFSVAPATTGTLLVTVTKHNYIPYQGSATVMEADTQDPVIALSSPNGGENWAIGSEQQITWTATDNNGVTSVSILLSTTGGTFYTTTIALGEPNDGSFSWTVPATPTTRARIKVIAYDAAGNSGEDASNANFTIADRTAPVVSVTTPNGGELWEIGQTYTILWNATDEVGVTAISILLSKDGGATFADVIATGEANDGQFAWTVPAGTASETARIKVVARDRAGNSAEDMSDNDFAISDPSSGIMADAIPARLEFAGVLPNPSSAQMTIHFGIPQPGEVALNAFDAAGRRVEEIARGFYPAGYHAVEWRAQEGGLATGIYFVRLTYGNEQRVQRVMVRK